MKTIHLHIGCYKTGTTSIQNTLFKNRAILNQIGYNYPGNHNNHHFSFFATEASIDDWPRQFKSIDKSKLEQIKKRYFQELERGLNSKFEEQIISTEYLFTDNRKYIEKYVGFLKNFADEIRVYIVLRKPSNYFKSAQQQMIKARSYVSNPDNWRLNFRNVIEAWSTFTNVEVIEYQKDVDSSKLLCDKIGVGYQRLNKIKQNSNVSLSIEQILLLEKIQACLYRSYEDRFKNHLGVLHQIKFSGLHKPELKSVVDSLIYQNHYKDLLWLKENFDIDFLNEECEVDSTKHLPSFEREKVSVRDVFRVPDEQMVEKFEAHVIDLLLKKIVQRAS